MNSDGRAPHHVALQPIHTATPDTTKLSCLCRVRFGGVNWILPTIRRQKILSLNTFRAIVQFTPAHQTRHRQHCLVVSGGRCELDITGATRARPLTSYLIVAAAAAELIARMRRCQSRRDRRRRRPPRAWRCPSAPGPGEGRGVPRQRGLRPGNV